MTEVITRGGEKNRLLINCDYNIDDYDSIITFQKNDLEIQTGVLLLLASATWSTVWSQDKKSIPNLYKETKLSVQVSLNSAHRAAIT